MSKTLTRAELIRQHQEQAEADLAKAKGAVRLERGVQLASMAAAHAALALSYQMEAAITPTDG